MHPSVFQALRRACPRRRLLPVLALLALLCLVAACLPLGSSRPSPTAGAGRSGGTLRVALPTDIVTLDPALLTDTTSAIVTAQIHEPLFVVDQDLEIVPWLAERLEQPDPSTYVITLRRGITFSNGEELTADDVKFTFDRLMDPATKSPRAWRLTDALESSESIQVLDRYTVKVTLKQPFAPFLERLTQASCFILNREAVERAGEAYARQPVGTGPFTLSEWRTGDQVVLERNPAYWAGPARVDRVVFRPLPDTQTRLAELESGGVDLALSVPADQLERLRAEGKVQVQTAETINVFYLGFNTRKAPLTSLPLRQAIAYAINRQEMLERLFGGIGRVAVSALSPTSWAFNPAVERYDYDPERARARLQAAGGPPAEPLELAFNQAPELTQVAERIQAQLKENLGLNVVLKPMEWGAFLEYIKSGNNHQMYLLNWTGTVDPDSMLFPLFHSKNFGGAGNRMFYQNERVDQLLTAAQRTVDQQERRQLYAEAQELIARDAPWVPLRHGVVSAAIRPGVEGYRLHPLNTQVYTDVTVP